MYKSSTTLGNQGGTSGGSAFKSLNRMVISENTNTTHERRAAKKVRRIKALVLNIPLKKKPIKMIGLQYQEKGDLRKIKNQGTTIFLRRPVAAFTTTI
jgi:hypothetical protein